jgi:hypothetical protein
VTRQPLPAQAPAAIPVARPVDRRSLLTGVLSGAIGAALPDAGVTGVDPTLAAIDAHAKAYAELDRALGRQEELEGALLQRFGGFDEAAFDGDPSWIALQAELDSLHEAETRAALSLLRAEPSTPAGETARRRYVAALASVGTSGPLSQRDKGTGGPVTLQQVSARGQ